ncbi:hypothetical protein [Nocardia sp. NPDC051570]|uniref:hypothetical protein n=1 Tax=Nocardia sp. NPDC051570 TaxID=3364324 RepID=UPI0037B79E1F
MNDLDLMWLRELVSHRYVVEILDTLAERPRTARELIATRTQARDVGRALRTLAAQGFVCADGEGSWDTTPPLRGPIRLTPAGLNVVDLLSNFLVWEALYEIPEASAR